MFSISQIGEDKNTSNYCEFICDDVTDINFLPTSKVQVNGILCAPGSVAFVVHDSSCYMLDNTDKWCKI